MRATRPSFSIAFRSFWLTTGIPEEVVASPYRTLMRPRRSLGSFDPFACRMKVRRMPRTPPNRPLRRRHVSRRSLTGSRWRGCGQARGRPVVPRKHERGEVEFMRQLDEPVQRGRPGVEGRRPGNDVAASSRPRVSACSSFSCFPDEPRKMRGLSFRAPLPHHLPQCTDRVAQLPIAEVRRRTKSKYLATGIRQDAARMQRLRQ